MGSHNMNLSTEPFKLIKNRQKTVEVRLFDNKRKQIKINDNIIFTHLNNKNEKIEVKIISLHIHPTFKNLFEHFSPSNFGDGLILKDRVDRMLKYYSLEDEEKFGVIGIKIHLI